LLHRSVLEERLCLVAQVAVLGRRWLGHGADQKCRCSDLLAGPGQTQGTFFAAAHHDQLLGGTSRLSILCTIASTLLLEGETQFLRLPAFLVELGHKLSEL